MAAVTNSPNMQVYTFAATKVSSTVSTVCGPNSGVSQLANKLPSILNGSYDAFGDVASNLPIKDPTAKLLVGSALDILKTWLGAGGKGADRADAQNAKANAQAAANNMSAETNATESDVNNIMNDVSNQAEGANNEMDGAKKTIDELEADNEQSKEEITRLTEENRQIDEQIAALYEKYQLELPKPKDGEKGGEPDYGNANLDAFPEDVQSKIKELLAKRGENSALITGFSDKITSNSSQIEAGYQQIDNFASGIINTIDSAKGAVSNLTNVLSGKQKMFSQEQIINASTQLVKSAINGTEGGVLAAFATAAGVSSIFSFGATAYQAEQAGIASADKFASVPARVASQLGIKLVENFTKQAVNNALAQLSNSTGVNFTQMYSDAMQIYNMASAGNANASLDLASNSSQPKAPTTPTTPQNGGGNVQKPNERNLA